MRSSGQTMFWLSSIGATLIVVTLLAALLAQQQRNRTFSIELLQHHQTNSQYLQKIPLLLQQDAVLAAELVHANSIIRQGVLDAAKFYRLAESDTAEIAAIRQQLLPELLSQWQALQPFAVRQLHLHLGPDAFTLLRAHRPERHSDRLHDVRPLVMSVLQQGAVESGLEVGRHGIGLRAVVPVKDEHQSTLAAIEVGFGVSALIRQQQLLMERQGITNSGIALLVERDALQVMHRDMQNFQAGTEYWLTDGEPSGFLQNWLQQNGLAKSVTEPQMHRVASGERHYLVSVIPWYGYQQPSEQSASLVLLAWRDITDLMLAQKIQNRRLWLLWFIACLFSLALIVFLALRLQKATAHSIKNQQLQLQWSEQRLSALFTLSPLPILLNRMADGAFIESNLAMERLVGYTQQELAVLSYWDLTPESYANDEQQQLESLTSKGRYGPYRKEYRHKDGHLIPIELNGVLFENPAGEQMIWTIVQDLTERNQLDKMKDEFISTVSHELRTPLTSIAGSLSLVLAGAAGELTDKSKKMLDIAQRNCKRLTSLVNDLLDMEKLVAGKVTFQPQCIELAELLQEAVEQNMPYAQSNQSQLRLEDVGEIQVLADPARVQQVLTNLLSNAVKFSPAGSVVRITTQPKQSFVRITIIDEGPGLTAREISGLFQRFSQLSNGTTKQHSGTGLGLAICREIVQQSGGRIGVDSQPGQGACFWFELPLIEPVSAMGSSKRILILEDDADIACTLQAMLQQQGFDSDWAANLHSAWQLLARNTYCLVTLDLRLNNEHGSDFFLRLRDNQATQTMPVLVISAFLDKGKLQLGAIANAIDWLEKPIDPDALAARIHALLESYSWQSDARLLHVEDDDDIAAIVQMHLEPRCRYYRAASLNQARALLHQHRFDALLLDIGLPDGEGWGLLSDIHKLQGDIPVMVFSAQECSTQQQSQVSMTFAKSRIEPAELAERIKAILNQ